jgi:molecular chaperone Hsp33
MDVADTLQRFLLERAGARGAVVKLAETWRQASSRVDHPDTVRGVLGHAMVASALLASTLKFNGTLTLQVQGKGPLELLVVQCTQALALRGVAKAKPVAAEMEDFRDLVGGGHLAVTIEATDTERYQGIVPLESASLAACLEGYFERSEQLATRLWLACDGDRAAGLLLQRLPNAGADHEDDWTRLQALALTLGAAELLATPTETLLSRLFPDEHVRVFKPAAPRFHCPCSRARIEPVLRMLGNDDLRALLAEQGRVAVACEFCGKRYTFDRVDVEGLLTTGTLPPTTDTRH